MIELLRAAAAAAPESDGVLTNDHTYSHAAIARRSELVATALRDRAIHRFAILDHDAATVLTLLGAASLVGSEACQYPPTDDVSEVARLAGRFDHDVIVTSQSLPGVAATVIDPMDLVGREAYTAGVPSARPLLVLTTGTTGAPRGVRHDWNRLVRSVGRVPHSPDQRWLLAYGLHQFAGLQMLLHVSASAAVLVAPAPRRPREGLEAMRTYAVTHASATPTYWRFLMAELRADGGAVPALQQITLGGEAVPGPLLDEIASTFPDARVSQIYAANEFGPTGSVRDRLSGLSVAMLEADEDADIAMKIVDGELWVRSRIGMLGYYGEEPVDADGWRPSGDRVEVVGDRVHFRGRMSEVINVGGTKVDPLPVEERIAAVPGVDMARVYGRPNAMTGAIVAVDVVASPTADQATVKDAIRNACDDLRPEARPRSIKFVESVPLVGGKIVRRSNGDV